MEWWFPRSPYMELRLASSHLLQLPHASPPPPLTVDTRRVPMSCLSLAATGDGEERGRGICGFWAKPRFLLYHLLVRHRRPHYGSIVILYPMLSSSMSAKSQPHKSCLSPLRQRKATANSKRLSPSCPGLPRPTSSPVLMDLRPTFSGKGL